MLAKGRCPLETRWGSAPNPAKGRCPLDPAKIPLMVLQIECSKPIWYYKIASSKPIWHYKHAISTVISIIDTNFKNQLGNVNLKISNGDRIRNLKFKY